jgi:hypothetical protein
MVVNSLASWMSMRLLRPRTQPSPSASPTQTQQLQQQQQKSRQVSQANHEG